MNKVIHIRITSAFLLAAFVWLLSGCVSSGETGTEGERAVSPVRILGPIDTARFAHNQSPQANARTQAKADSVKTFITKKNRKAPTFKSKYDTVHVTVVANTKKSQHIRIPIERPEHPYYTIQIGAFGKMDNALRAQKKAKGRYSDQLIFNKYIKHVNLYRVSVGRFENLQEAFSLQRAMVRKYPQEYSKSWINIIP